VLAANCAYRSASQVVAHSFVQIASAFLKELGVDPAAPKNVDELLKNTLYVHAKAADVSFRAIRAMGELAWRMEAQEGEPVLYIEQVLYGRGGEAFARLKHHLFPAHYDVSFSVLNK
jgi:DNA-binding GntR family transcriptional regulator